jgi:hypothetical protein
MHAIGLLQVFIKHNDVVEALPREFSISHSWKEKLKK